MNDGILYTLLFEFIKRSIDSSSFSAEFAQVETEMVWNLFTASGFLHDHMGEIDYQIRAIAQQIDRADKLKCQHCRIEEGLFVEPPVRAHDLCKRHRQEYEELYVDKTLTQIHPGIGVIQGKEGMACAPPQRSK